MDSQQKKIPAFAGQTPSNIPRERGYAASVFYYHKDEDPWLLMQQYGQPPELNVSPPYPVNMYDPILAPPNYLPPGVSPPYAYSNSGPNYVLAAIPTHQAQAYLYSYPEGQTDPPYYPPAPAQPIPSYYSYPDYEPPQPVILLPKQTAAPSQFNPGETLHGPDFIVTNLTEGSSSSSMYPNDQEISSYDMRAIFY